MVFPRARARNNDNIEEINSRKLTDNIQEDFSLF